MPELFEPTKINGMEIKNRLVRSATWEGMCAPDGRPTDRLINCYRDLALGGVGLIVSSYTYVRPEGKQLPGKMGIYTDDFAADFQKLTAAVHEAGGLLAVQLVHAGGQTDPNIAGRQPLAPSAIKVDQYPQEPEELTRDGIKDIIGAFGDSARRAKAWGFDAVQFHGAHGYLINQFLSPHTNLRSDEYGGSVENRTRFLLEVYHEVRETAGRDYPVMIKLTGSDNMDNGLVNEDAVYAAGKLSEAGIDAIEISSGTSASGGKGPARTKINDPEKEAYNLDLAQQIKKAVSCPVMVVGGMRSIEVAEKAIQEGDMDYIAMARPLIREPELPNRWLQGNRGPARCISCNGCFQPGLEEGGIYCVIEKKEQEKARQGDSA
ncbi:MAG: NADH:flavin oxidoreductase [Deltaproteobacteria bacterium]|jgi:2,4-dienoyl-CoA reductase-like NADH-dependent reductase (Old Yellow Enzyme family)|nr:NADH:flavin oxidoreductase [Deltaproteobacteria bacterium]